jgi:hypothetical protein
MISPAPIPPAWLHSIRFSGGDILEVSRFLEFMGDYSAELTP